MDLIDNVAHTSSFCFHRQESFRENTILKTSNVGDGGGASDGDWTAAGGASNHSQIPPSREKASENSG
jgi:hypothetical protein